MARMATSAEVVGDGLTPLAARTVEDAGVAGHDVTVLGEPGMRAKRASAGSVARRRELVTSHPEVACEVCGRRLLRGERPERFLADGCLTHVCELCIDRAHQAGWVRTSGLDATPPEPYRRHRRRRTLLERLRRRRVAPEGAVEPLD